MSKRKKKSPSEEKNTLKWLERQRLNNRAEREYAIDEIRRNNESRNWAKKKKKNQPKKKFHDWR